MCDQAILGDAFSQQGIEDAKSVAQRLGMDFYVFDAVDAFKSAVVGNFISCYEQGLTPNPCVVCNRHIKFSYLLDKALELGCDYIVTGHYAQVKQDENTGRYLLYKVADEAKDQSYFLACLNQRQLSHIRFPLGSYTKAEIRQIAEQQGFLTAKKKDSQDICFVPDGDFMGFICRYTGKEYPQGKFLDLQGNPVGKHGGAIRYTLGQRKGLGLAMGEPVYVCAKDMEKNTVTVGTNEELFRTSLRANDWNWIPFQTLTEPMRVTAKVRYRHTEQPATVYPEENGFASVEFDEPQRAITTGQAVVLYDGDLVIGGGTITEIL
jgi:tRNA-specific 2-thiouridylase